MLNFHFYHNLRTESPSGLNESDIGVVNEEGDRALEVIRLDPVGSQRRR